MISGIDLNATVDYVMKEDKENPTVWKLGAIATRQMAKIASGMNEKDFTGQMILLVKHGLKGWSNFKVSGDIEFRQDNSGGVHNELLDLIPFKVIAELGAEILKLNQLSGDEQKN